MRRRTKDIEYTRRVPAGWLAARGCGVVHRADLENVSKKQSSVVKEFMKSNKDYKIDQMDC